MEKKIMAINARAKIVSFELLNEEFTKCKCYIQALGKNRNFSHFSKESVIAALPTLYNIPVVGHIVSDEDGNYMGSHDIELSINDEGDISFKSLCIPFGVVPLQDSVTFEEVVEPNGRTKTYLVADVILWTGRFPEIVDTIYSEDLFFNQSMEILVDDYGELDEDPNYMDIAKYSYSALCLLGKDDDVTSDRHSEPCFPKASVVPYHLKGNSESFIALMQEMKTELGAYFSSLNATKKEGGERVKFTQERKLEILKAYNLEDGAFEFEIEDDTTEESFTEIVEAFIALSAAPESESAVQLSEQAQFAKTYNEKCDMLRLELRNFETDDTWYWLRDFDDTYVYVEIYGKIDDVGEYGSKNGRCKYSTDNSNATIDIGSFEEMIMKWLTLDEAAKLELARNAFEELAEYKRSKEISEHEAAIDTALNEFIDLLQIEEFNDLATKAYSMSVEDLKLQCFALKGKHVAMFAISPNQNQQPRGRMQLPKNTQKSDRYGDLFEKYGKTK